jgi:DNA helicase-2/ATP-dependent DNA helicase PcrA
VVTFTDKAAGEMVDRLRALGLPGVTARTFHAHALSQLRHFWPAMHDGAPLPDLLDGDAAAAATIRARKHWFSVDEYQDTNPLQQRLLELWLGDGRDVCVVGDEDQTIYTFTGATSRFLTDFETHWPGARTVTLSRNYRSSPAVLELANRLLASTGPPARLVATRPSGPEPTITALASEDAELAELVLRIRGWLRKGVPAAEIAVLVRTNAQLAPIEEALTRAGIAYQVRGVRFYDRPEVKAAVATLKRRGPAAQGSALATAVRERFRDELGHDEAVEPEGAEARERAAALETLLAILDDEVRLNPELGVAAYVADLEARAAHEREHAGEGVTLSTLHRAKGLEWDAVLLPSLEEGSLPVRQAFDDAAALEEERRLLYVGITRARTHLALSWAGHRMTRGREGRRQPSRFLHALRPRRPVAVGPGRPTGSRPGSGGVIALPDAFGARPARPKLGDDPLTQALRAWRFERARTDGQPAFVIAHDTTLAAIAEARPRTLAALRRVKGMGPQKLERYGEELLAVIERAVGDG